MMSRFCHAFFLMSTASLTYKYQSLLIVHHDRLLTKFSLENIRDMEDMDGKEIKQKLELGPWEDEEMPTEHDLALPTEVH